MSAKTRLFDRREILAVAASAATVAWLPFRSLATAALGAHEQAERLLDWSIDDQWGVVPRWDAIPSVPRQSDEARLAAVSAVDAPFLA